ncbi:MAG: DEAD/DEAH box helicase [Desulfobacterales bacterium]|uniref:DEAD/DEAH box helicase n=1 Tax=Candidatus Desulfaltia bathyphila TaxID=2841697 RepID=A0A8J6N665_9BACT|nr:DEAD/DEAH box helicase [Candidatus Desulfaltia bathyphila]MBL7195915.1 DEAD/DEAH box helicase [Desulfobacterales bacterium]MBL7207953.1 DEAD/DEAH box helicase [Desulfobacterales bacterium]
MHRQNKYQSRKRGKKKKTDNGLLALKLKPKADAGLKKVFSSIGVPKKSAFKPDPFQLKALSAIKKADCLVTAPTGAGKTWIAEKAIAEIHAKHGKSWYASPLKALSNSKYHEFSAIFGADNVGILTGDRKENPDAPIIVGTTEILRNQLYDAMHSGESLSADLVILDEAHFLGDEERGVVWEEIMIYLPSRIPLLLLSATIGNAHQIAGWLLSIRSKKCIVIEEKKRPVPLFPLFLHPSGKLLPLVTQNAKKRNVTIYKKVSDYLNQKNPPLIAHPRKLPPFGQIMRVLDKYNLLPAIFFLKSRADCDNALKLCTEDLIIDQNRQDRRIRLSRRIEDLTAKNSRIKTHRQLRFIKHFAIGSHHSGQLPAWKLLLEILMTEGLLNVIFATSTVAAGVNFPARTIVFLNSDRFNGKEFLPLNSTEFHQMTGRAGRRGMDNIGFAVAIPGKFMDIRLIAKLIKSSPSDVTSQIRINFSMTLNLLVSYAPDQIEDLLKRSFASYLIAKRKKGSDQIYKNDDKFLWQDFMRHFNFLIKTGYAVKNGELTDDGIWASHLRVDQPLMIAEGFRLGLFPVSDPALLAAIMASFVSEQKSDEKIDNKLIPKKLLTAFANIEKNLSPFAKRLADKGFEVRPLFLRPALTIYAWAIGQPWEKVVSVSKMEEGDLAMLVLRTADHLRHIRALRKVFPRAAATSEKSIELIMREPVIIDYKLL